LEHSWRKLSQLAASRIVSTPSFRRTPQKLGTTSDTRNRAAGVNRRARALMGAALLRVAAQPR
jgi:hypothetical protein